ncbi:hypothetical protein DFH07DRAFT_952055 [Mycena maculata]|uniref:Prolipoprotein diacylglyceryl transferase n=1 Tax=Mycena maculata TaxID=230809 RepID=A0AAD7K2M6_9AGAR|nr:hypothetical protein DFH07DRAFT_952055 [Mycena maculata]
MGMGFAALVFTAFTRSSQSPAETGSLKVALHITLVAAIAGARLLSIIMDDGLVRLRSHPLRTIFRPGFWLHGGLFGAAGGVVFTYWLGHVPDLPRFAASLAVGLPIYEAFSRIGCHTYGCCYGRCAASPPKHPLWRLFPFAPVRYDHPRDYAATRLEPQLLGQPLIPIQLISAMLFLFLFACVSLPLALCTMAQLAGATTLGLHAAWGLSFTGRLALVQAAGSAVWLARILRTTSSMPVSLDVGDMLAGERLETCAAAALVGIIAYGIHVDEIGTWVPESKCVEDSEKSQ